MKHTHTYRRVPHFHIPDRAQESFQIIEVDESYSGCSWHFHSDLQLCHVTSGTGERIIGDCISPISEGEVVLLGSNLPHVWRYDPMQSGSIKATVVHFRESFLGSDFILRPELRDIKLLLARAGQGLQARGQTRERVADIVEGLPGLDGFARILSLLNAIHLLAESSELETISGTGFQPVAAELDIERLRRACDFIKENMHCTIDRDCVAKVTHMSPGGFSRFFKAHTGMTFQEFLADVRVGHACRLLMDSEQSVCQIAFECGFSDVSTFNRTFRKYRDTTPSQYRLQVRNVRKP